MEFIIGFIIAILLGVWVYKDAEKRYPEKSSAPGYWALGTILLLIVFFPLYLIFRPKKIKEKTDTSISSFNKTNLQDANFCSKCGSKIERCDSFCKGCGEKIISSNIENVVEQKQQGQTEKETKKPIWKKWWFWVVGIIVLLIFIGSFAEDDTKQITDKQSSITFEEVKDGAIEVNYNELFRNNEQYIGEIIYYRGKIIQVSEGWGDNYVLRINVTKGEYGFWENDVYVNYKGQRVLEDDVVDFWGIVKGTKTYKTVLGASRSIPKVDALYLEIADSSTVQIIDSQTQEEKSQNQALPTTQQSTSIPSGLGSKSNPIPIGATVRIGDWDFKIVSSVSDARQVVFAHNMFNDPPKSGHQFFMIKIQATYIGSTSDRLMWSFGFNLVGDSGVAYSRAQNSCGVIPDEISEAGEVFTDGTVSGNICWEVQTNDINSLIMFIDPYFSFDDSERVFMLLPR